MILQKSVPFPLTQENKSIVSYSDITKPNILNSLD